MNEPNLVVVLAGVFGALAGFMGVLGVFYSPVAFGVAVPFAVSAALLWYHGSGRLAARVRRTAGGRAGGEAAGRRTHRDATTGARGPGFGDGRRTGGGRGGASRERDGARGRYAPQGERVGPTREEALSILGLEPGASRAEIRDAYRERAKDLHPDRDGDEDAFKELNRAYDRLRE